MDFPVDVANLSFSDDEAMASLFITQSTFNSVTTQQVNDAVDFLDGLGDVSVGDTNNGQLNRVSEEEKQDEMCEKIFDFSDDYDNGYRVSTQDDPILVTRKSDGKVFTVGDSKATVAEHIIDINSALPANYDAEKDLKRFKSIVSDEELCAIKNKRLVYFLSCHSVIVNLCIVQMKIKMVLQFLIFLMSI